MPPAATSHAAPPHKTQHHSSKKAPPHKPSKGKPDKKDDGKKATNALAGWRKANPDGQRYKGK